LGVPNAFPFKEQVLAEREEVRRRREEERERKRKGIVETPVAENGLNGVNGENGEKVETVVTENGFTKGIQIDSDDEELMEEESDMEEDSEMEDDDDEEEDEDDSEDEEDLLDSTSESEWPGIDSESETSDIETLTQHNTARNSKPPLYQKAITRSDLVIFTLDARCPSLTRSLDTEKFAKKKGKSCLFVLNHAGIFTLLSFSRRC
jgi:GNL3L/Grn1 putative GTPase